MKKNIWRTLLLWFTFFMWSMICLTVALFSWANYHDMMLATTLIVYFGVNFIFAAKIDAKEL